MTKVGCFIDIALSIINRNGINYEELSGVIIVIRCWRITMLTKLKMVLKKLRFGEKGFTLIEILVVIAILGCLAGVAIPRLAQFADRGRPETADTERRSIEIALGAMLLESTTGNLTPISDVTDMDTVVTTDTTALVLSSYLGNLDSNGEVKTDFTYTFAADGTVTQNTP